MSLSYKDHRRKAAIARFVRKAKAAAYSQARDDLLRDLYDRGRPVVSLRETPLSSASVGRPVHIAKLDMNLDMVHLDFRQVMYQAAQSPLRPGHDERQFSYMREDAIRKMAEHMFDNGLVSYERSTNPRCKDIVHTWRAFIAREERR